MLKRILRLALAWAFLSALLLPSGALARDELKNTDPDKYFIYLNIPNQVVTVYEKDGEGEYTRIVRRFLCTTGKAETPTPTGTYRLGARERFGKFANFNSEYARYWTQVIRGIYFHSVMFGSRDVERLKAGPLGKLGSRASHGCIRLYVEDAKWLYYNACPGTLITIGGENRITQEEKRALRTQLSYADYNAFQMNIHDGEELENRKAWVSVDNAQLRTGNGSNDRFIKRLKLDTELEVIQEGEPWVKVVADGREGYVKRAFITYEKGKMQSSDQVRITKGTTNIYAQPDKKSGIICRMASGDVVHVLEEDDVTGWLKISYYSTVGYVYKKNTTLGWGVLDEYAHHVDTTKAVYG